jgi:hypothetical protein
MSPIFIKEVLLSILHSSVPSNGGGAKQVYCALQSMTLNQNGRFRVVAQSGLRAAPQRRTHVIHRVLDLSEQKTGLSVLSPSSIICR